MGILFFFCQKAMSEQIEKNGVSLRKKSSGPKLRTISGLTSIFSRPKSLNMHPDLQMKKVNHMTMMVLLVKRYSYMRARPQTQLGVIGKYPV